MTPLEAALSSRLAASSAAALASSALPASAASRNLRTDVLSADFTALLRSWAASVCLLRLIWDLMFATKARLFVWKSVFGVPGLGPDTKGDDISGRQWRPNRCPPRSCGYGA